MSSTLSHSSSQNRQPARLPRLLALAAGAGLAASALAEKPAALSELSVTVKETYDSNVYGTEFNPTLAGLPEVADVESWVTVISPKVGLNLRSALGLADDSAVTAFNLGYDANYSFYHSASTETNQRHNFSQQLKTKSEAVTFALDNTFTYVDGKSTTPQYGLLNAYGSASSRERKEQFQDRAKLQLRYDADVWFARAVANVLYYDLKTKLHQPTGTYVGYQNYIDRQDLNIGFDVGGKLNKDVALWTGYRYGAQGQDNLPWSQVDSASTYSRVLVGAEGKLASWLKVDLQAGPDFRSFDNATATRGIAGKNHTWLYTEASATATLSENDSLTLANKIWNFVSSTGVASYRDSTYAATLKHKFSSALSGTLGFRILGSDYALPTIRKDWFYTYSAGLRYDIDKQWSVTVDYARNEAKNKLSTTTYPGREYSQDILTFGLRAAF